MASALLNQSEVLDMIDNDASSSDIDAANVVVLLEDSEEEYLR